MVKFAKCCSPVPGDPIIGFITRGYGVSVHRQDCINVRAARKNGEDGRWIKTEWATAEKHSYHAAIKVTAKSSVGLGGEVLMQLANMKINVSEMTARDNEDGYCDLYLTIGVTGKEQLELVIARLSRTSGVVEVKRMAAGS